jgi:signal-transduction protein with cAMP-binding, CBS, and nucleotidyltransferase domain
MEVREGMSSIVLAVGPGHTLRDAANKMTEKGTGAALVFDEESPAPRIITERDILNSIGWSLEQAAEEMVKLRIRHLVVVERGELVGVLSMRDIVRCWTQAGATSSMTPP